MPLQGLVVLFALLTFAFTAGYIAGYLRRNARWRDPQVAGEVLHHLYALAQVKWIKSDKEEREHCPVCGWNEKRGEYARVSKAKEDLERHQRSMW